MCACVRVCVGTCVRVMRVELGGSRYVQEWGSGGVPLLPHITRSIGSNPTRKDYTPFLVASPYLLPHCHFAPISV